MPAVSPTSLPPLLCYILTPPAAANTSTTFFLLLLSIMWTALPIHDTIHSANLPLPHSFLPPTLLTTTYSHMNGSYLRTVFYAVHFTLLPAVFFPQCSCCNAFRLYPANIVMLFKLSSRINGCYLRTAPKAILFYKWVLLTHCDLSYHML